MRIVRLTPLLFAVCSILEGALATAQSYKRAYTFPETSLYSSPAFGLAVPGVAAEAQGVPMTEPQAGAGPTFYQFGLFGVPRVSTTMIPLPVPVDPNDLLMQDVISKSDFGAGYAIASADGTADPVAVFRLVPNVQLDGTYDTGNPGSSSLSPSHFAVRGSDDDRSSGIFSLRDSSASLKTDVQVPSITAQVYMELLADEEDGLDFRQVYGRAGNWLGGTYFSSFSDNGTLPQTIVPDGGPAGAYVDPNVAQLQYVRLYNSGIMLGVAIENPNNADFSLVSSDDARLKRIPDFVTRVRYQPLNAWGSLQGALLLRNFAYQDIGGEEHFTPAVSYSTNARFKTIGDDNVRLGFIGGEGAGTRIFGLNAHPIAAGPENGELEALQNIGAFAAYQHYWSKCLWSNAAYGYAFADTTPAMSLLARHSQNGWVNLIWNNPSGKIALGLEYQFGELELGNGEHGFNHHIQFSLQIGKGYSYPVDNVASAVAASAGGMTPSGLSPSGLMSTQAAPMDGISPGPAIFGPPSGPTATTPIYPRM